MVDLEYHFPYKILKFWNFWNSEQPTYSFILQRAQHNMEAEHYTNYTLELGR